LKELGMQKFLILIKTNIVGIKRYSMHCKKYEAICKKRTIVHIDFKRRHPHRNGRRGALYTIGLEDIPPFVEWLEMDVENVV